MSWSLTEYMTCMVTLGKTGI